MAQGAALRPPIVVSEHGDISVFSSIEAASRKLEPIDVQNAEYIAYDSDGFLLILVATHPVTTISGRSQQPAQAEVLSQALLGFIARNDPAAVPAEATSLQELLVHFVQRFGYTA